MLRSLPLLRLVPSLCALAALSTLSTLAACTAKDEGGPDSVQTAPTFNDPDGASLLVAEDGTLGFTDANGQKHPMQIALGFVRSPDEQVNYDPYNLKDPELDYAVPAGLEWAQATSASWNVLCAVNQNISGLQQGVT